MIRTPLSRSMFSAAAWLTIGFGAAPAQAEVLRFSVALDGKHGDQPTDSAATGIAQISVDTEGGRLSVDLTLDGITADALWDKLVAAPIGPIHFHTYASAAGGGAALVLPLPYGTRYAPTEKGLRVTWPEYDYAVGAALAKSTLTLNDFVIAIRSGSVVLNVHTDKFNHGEISGVVTEN